jgi:hypothetical protein
MAKRNNNEPNSGADKAEVRVFYAEVKGNNESVQDALKTMLAIAMNRPSQPPRVISEQKANGTAAVLPPRSEVGEVEEAGDQVEESEVLEDEAASQNTRKPRGSGKKVNHNVGLSLVPNLDFMPDGQQTLKQFLDEKKSKTDMEATLAMVYYVQHVMGVTKIGPSHVRTAFHEAGKAVPADVRQTIRNIKNNKAWLDFTDIEDIKTTTQGDNFVLHEMGKSGKSE